MKSNVLRQVPFGRKRLPALLALQQRCGVRLAPVLQQRLLPGELLANLAAGVHALAAVLPTDVPLQVVPAELRRQW